MSDKVLLDSGDFLLLDSGDKLLLDVQALEAAFTISVDFDISFGAAILAPLEAAFTIDVDFDADPGALILAPLQSAFTIDVDFASTLAGEILDGLRANFVVTLDFDTIFRPRGVIDPETGVERFHRRTVVVDQYGNAIAELENAVQGDVTYELNRWAESSITLPVTDPKSAAVLSEKIREVQIWRGDQLLLWGPMTRPAANKTTVSTPVKDALWYLSRRYVGEANRRNYLQNPKFDEGDAHWNYTQYKWFLDYDPVGDQVGVTDGFPGVPNKYPATRVVASYSGYEDNADGACAAYQELTVDGGQRGRTGTFVAWVYQPSMTPDDEPLTTKPPPLQRAIVIARLPTDYATNNFWTRSSEPWKNTWGGQRAFFTDTIEYAGSRFDEKHPKDLWVRHECSITVPAGNTEIIHCQIEFASFISMATLTSLTFDDALEAFDTDQASIVDLLVSHAQDTAFGKNDVNLTVNATPTGVKRDYVGLFQEHPNVWSEIEQFTEMADGIDISLAYTPTERIVQIHSPQRGMRRPNLPIDLTKNLEDFAWTFDGEGASNAVVVLGNGDGSDREEASAVNADAFANGLILEEVISAPQNTAPEGLQAVADERLAVAVFPEVLQVTMRDASYLGRCFPGDYLPVRIRRGGLVIAEDYRIIKLTLTPADKIVLTLNRRDW